MAKETIGEVKLEKTVLGSLSPAKQQEIEERNRLIEENMGQVKIIAMNFLEKGIPVNLDELISMGYIGLIGAAEKFDPQKNTKFNTFAEYKIKGAILDGLRKLDFLSRGSRKKQKQIEEVVDKLSNKYGRIPTEDEIANELGLTLEKHRAISLQPSAKMILSLEHGNISRDIGLRDYFLDKNVTSPESVAITGQKSERLKKAISQLPERSQKMINLYYFEDLSMKEISLKLGISESTVSIIVRSTLEKLKDLLKK